MLTNSKLEDIASQKSLISDLTDDILVEFCTIANQRYRDGIPIISDEDYDFIFIAELFKRLPSHSFFQKIEAENEGLSLIHISEPTRPY